MHRGIVHRIALCEKFNDFMADLILSRHKSVSAPGSGVTVEFAMHRVCWYTLTERNDIIDTVTRSWMYITQNSLIAPSSPGEYELRYCYKDSWGPGGGSATYGNSDVLFWVGATCSDGVQNQLEQAVDCDGPCDPCQ